MPEEILKTAYKPKSDCKSVDMTDSNSLFRNSTKAACKYAFREPAMTACKYAFKKTCEYAFRAMGYTMDRAFGNTLARAAAILAATGWMLLLPHMAGAQIAVSTMDRDTLRTGDLFTYRIEISGINFFNEVIYPDSASFGPDFVMRGKQVQASRLQHELVYKLQFFGIDTEAVPELYAGLVTQSDTLYLIIPRAPFIYQSRVDASDEELRPLKPIFPFFRSIWPYILAGILLALAAAYLLYRFRDRLFSKKDPVEVPGPATEPFRSPLEDLRTGLDRIEKQYPNPSLDAKLFYTELGDAFRMYYERAWIYPAMESTTKELIGFLISEDADPHVLDLLAHLLEEADLVKFAKYKPNESDCRYVMKGGRILAERIAVTDRNRIAMLQEKHKEQFADHLPKKNSAETGYGLG